MGVALQLLRWPGVPGWGFALFLAVNAVQVWGGVFPFLPLEFQTVGVTLWFYATQAAASLITYALLAAWSFADPRRVGGFLPFVSAPPMIVGSASLIAAMYVQGATVLVLVAAAGVLLGLGSTGMTLAWQRAFSSTQGERGDVLLVVGTGLSALIYFALHLCPVAVTAYLVPLVFLPLCAGALTVANRAVQLDQPMFTDVPSSHPAVYRVFVRDYWRSAVSAGAVGFVAGIMRAVALADVEAGTVVNVTSMLGALLSSGAILYLWQKLSFHLSMRKAYRWCFPVLVVAVVMLPFFDALAYVDVFAGFVYMLYAFVQMIMLVQCAQASRDRGICPVVTYAFCSGIMHVMQFSGFLCGWGCGLADGLGAMQLARAAILALAVMGLVLFSIWMRPSGRAKRAPDTVEFVAFGQGQARSLAEFLRHGGEIPAVSGVSPYSGERFAYARARGDDPDLEIPVQPMIDRISKQCQAVRLAFRLSDREAEIAELVVRGQTVARIAEKLGVSENTVRTHVKRVHTKLDVHSKEELANLVATFKPLAVEGENQQNSR